MRREFHVRFCEGGGVRSPSATRLVLDRRAGRSARVAGVQDDVLDLARRCHVNGPLFSALACAWRDSPAQIAALSRSTLLLLCRFRP